MLTDESRIRSRVFDVIRHIVDIPPIKPGAISGSRKDYLKPPQYSSFKGIDPLLFYIKESDWLFHPNDCKPNVEWPIDVSFMLMSPDLEKEEDPNLYLHVRRVRTVLAKNVRGYAPLVSPFMARIDIAMDNKGKFLSASDIVGYFGGKWASAQNTTTWQDGLFPVHDRNKTGNSYFYNSMGVAINLALRHRYEWAVNIGFENSPSVRIVTDPTGMKDLFRLRDVPDGRDRRDALMTWVSDHWREDRHDPDVEVYVRKHLRGFTKFEWRGMQCEVKPSRFDLEQRDKFIQEREAMRRDGKDRRTA